MSFISPNRNRPFHLVNGYIMYETNTTHSEKLKFEGHILDSCYLCNFCDTIIIGEDKLLRHYDLIHKDTTTTTSNMDTTNDPCKDINDLSPTNKTDETVDIPDLQISATLKSIEPPVERLNGSTVVDELQVPSLWDSMSSHGLDCLDDNDNIFSNENIDKLFSEEDSETNNANNSSLEKSSDVSISMDISLPSTHSQDELAPLTSPAEPEVMNTSDNDNIPTDNTSCETETASDVIPAPLILDTEEKSPELLNCEYDEVVEHRTMPRLSDHAELHLGSLLERNEKSCYVETGENSGDDDDDDNDSSLDLKDLRESKWFWCKVCDNYLPNLNELRRHVQAQHNINPSQINRYNYVTYDLEIARTIHNYQYFKD